jgi:hypothetical protein
MENLINLVGKTYTKIDDTSNTIFKIDSVEGEFILFENGMRCKENTLNSTFQEYMDPNIFFNVNKNSNVISNLLSNQVSKLIEDGVLNTNNNQHNIEEIEDIETKEEIIKIPRDTQQTTILNSTIKNDYEPVILSSQNNKVNPEISILNRVKRLIPIKFEISINELLPEREKMLMLNDMFETPMVDFLAEDILDKLLRSPELLLEQIKEKLFTYMNNKNTVKKTTVTTKAKTTTKTKRKIPTVPMKDRTNFL